MAAYCAGNSTIITKEIKRITFISTKITKTSSVNMPQMADCLVCHSQIEPPYSCAKCHDPKWAGLQPANHHAPDFHDKHSTKAIVKQGCATCHGRTFTCMGCHLG